MYLCLNYNQIEDKSQLIDDLFQTDFYAMERNKTALINKMNLSCESELPQYLFLHENKKLIGYYFLIGKENVDIDFPWLIVSNIDCLSEQQSRMFVRYAVSVWIKCNDIYMEKLAGKII